MNEYPCQQLLGGSGAAIYSNEDGLCDHPECNPQNNNNETHTLNACLARAVGKAIKENACGPTNLSWWYWEPETEEDFGEWIKWDPLQNASQMELVETHLTKAVKQYEFYTAWCPAKGLWEAFLSEYGKAGRPVFHPDKKRAFALAIWQMEQSRKETT